MNKRLGSQNNAYTGVTVS